MLFKLMIWKCFLILFIFNYFSIGATEHRPWLGNFYEFELRSSFIYQGYHWISSGLDLKKHSADDLFLNLSLANALPDPPIGAELELTQARTRRQKGDIDQVKLTGRYVWLDDIAGDPFSLTLGLSYIQAFRGSLKDVSSFHHGFYNTEFFLSIGKESPDESSWDSRWWSVLAIGVAEQGSAWGRLRFDYEKRWCNQHAVGTFLHSLWGFGHQKLRLNDFRGYGSLQHQSIDLGLRYTYLLEFYGTASLEYSYRLYARNFPAYTHHILAQVLYTFGL